MTFCKILKTARTERNEITAYENYDKFCTTPRYEIVVSRDGIGWHVEKAARTTWQRKFRELTEQY